MRYGAKILFEDVTTTFNPGRRYGLTRPYGSEKSTFRMILSGELEQQMGNVIRPLKMGILRQDQFTLDQFRVIDTVIMGNAGLWKALQERDAGGGSQAGLRGPRRPQPGGHRRRQFPG